jgi:molybdate transport system permease protein
VSRRRAEDRSGTPGVLVAPAVLGAVFLALPAAALLVKAPWSQLGPIYRSYQFWSALRVSVVSSLEATVICLVFGIPLAWILARVHLPGRSVLRTVVLLPLVLPPVVGGVALFFALGRKGIVGQYLDSWFGITLPFTQHGVVLAQAFVAMPFLIVTVEGAFRGASRDLEEAAATLGARRLRVFSRVTIPLVAPSLIAGTVLCWARAVGEYGATQVFGGNVPQRTQTMPTLVVTAFSNDPGAAVALSLPLMLVALVVLVALRDKWLRGAPAS